MAFHEDNEVLRGMQLHADVRHDLDGRRDGERALDMTLGGSDKGRGNCKRISQKLFRSSILKPLLIALTVKHIRSDVYTAHSVARVVDLQHGFNLCSLDNLRNIERAVSRAERLLWSSSSGKRLFMKVEHEMSPEITFKTISEKHMGKKVDGVSFYPQELFTYLINHFGLSDVAK
jgi:hypothetical protein